MTDVTTKLMGKLLTQVVFITKCHIDIPGLNPGHMLVIKDKRLGICLGIYIYMYTHTEIDYIHTYIHCITHTRYVYICINLVMPTVNYPVN